MPSPTQLRGGRAEQRAVFYLQRHGYRILDRHYTSRFGEIDILATKNSCLYIVEVKFRAREGEWPIELALTQGKVQRLILTFESWLAQHTIYTGTHVKMLWLLMTPQRIREVHIVG